MKGTFIVLCLVATLLFVAPFLLAASDNRKVFKNIQELKDDIKRRILNNPKNKKYNKYFRTTITPLKQVNEVKAKGGIDLCPTCISLLDQTINQLVNIILNAGVIGSCGKLCGYLQSYGSLTVMACNLVCDYLGVTEFIKIIENADLDAIFACQELRICPIHDCTLPQCAAFVNSRVIPQVVQKGSQFTAITQLQIFNQTGTGELEYGVEGPVTGDISGGELVPAGFAPGAYEIKVDVRVEDDQQNEVIWFPGQYKFAFAACEGECGSKHPHSRVLAESAALFNVTH
ncbi:hypothetical protein ABK040_015509 [Willaertia magna]